MAFTFITTSTGETAYGLAMSGSVHHVVAQLRGSRKLVTSTVGVKTAASGDTSLLAIPVLGRVVDVLAVSQGLTFSGNPIFISGYTQNPLVTDFSGHVLPPQVGCGLQSDHGALSGQNVIAITSLNGSMATQAVYSGYFVFKVTALGV